MRKSTSLTRNRSAAFVLICSNRAVIRSNTAGGGRNHQNGFSAAGSRSNFFLICACYNAIFKNISEFGLSLSYNGALSLCRLVAFARARGCFGLLPPYLLPFSSFFTHLYLKPLFPWLSGRKSCRRRRTKASGRRVAGFVRPAGSMQRGPYVAASQSLSPSASSSSSTSPSSSSSFSSPPPPPPSSSSSRPCGSLRWLVLAAAWDPPVRAL
jgi:hypothetical protein